MPVGYLSGGYLSVVALNHLFAEECHEPSDGARESHPGGSTECRTGGLSYWGLPAHRFREAEFLYPRRQKRFQYFLRR